MTAPVTGLAEVGLGRLLQLLEDHRRDLGRRELAPVDLDRRDAFLPFDHLVRDELDLLGHLGHAPAHEALDRVDGARRVRDRLALGDRADQALAVVREADDRGRRAAAFLVRDDDGLPALHHGHARVRGAEVDSDDLAFRHVPDPSSEWILRRLG